MVAVIFFSGMMPLCHTELELLFLAYCEGCTMKVKKKEAAAKVAMGLEMDKDYMHFLSWLCNW